MLFQRKLLINESDDSEMEEQHEKNDRLHHEIKMNLLSDDPNKTKLALQQMDLILSKYRNEDADLDKLDITLLKGIYKHDPNNISESEASFEVSSSELSEIISNPDLPNEKNSSNFN